MIQHISMFFFKEECTNEEKKQTEQWLHALGDQLYGIEDYKVGVNCSPKPPVGIADVPEFGDLVQIIDFTDSNAAATYPNHPLHKELIVKTSGFFRKVTAIDFEYDGVHF
jgi:hypothetical protein